MNGDHSEESKEKTTVPFTDKKNSTDGSSDRKSQTDVKVVVNVETKDDINIVQQQFDFNDSSNNDEAIVFLKQTKYESSEKAIEETTEKEEHTCTVEHPESPKTELNYKSINSEFPESDLNSRQNNSITTSIIQKEASIAEHIENSESDVTRCFSSSTQSDVTTHWIGGLAIVKSGDVICLDLNNEPIKRFDKKFSTIFSIEIPFACSGMIVTSNDEIAVTCLNEIHFYYM